MVPVQVPEDKILLFRQIFRTAHPRLCNRPLSMNAGQPSRGKELTVLSVVHEATPSIWGRHPRRRIDSHDPTGRSLPASAAESSSPIVIPRNRRTMASWGCSGGNGRCRSPMRRTRSSTRRERTVPSAKVSALQASLDGESVPILPSYRELRKCTVLPAYFTVNPTFSKR